MDRRKDLHVIEHNKIIRWIAPHKIENIYIQSIYVGQCYVDVDIERVSTRLEKIFNQLIFFFVEKGLFNRRNSARY